MHHHFIDRLALINSIIAGVALFPQVWVTYATGSIAGISPLTFFIILLNNIVWLLYGIHRSLLSITVAAFLNVLASLALVFALLFMS
jgi:uncharacterized protein with PQ loop repeat